MHRDILPAMPHNASCQMNSLSTQAMISCQLEVVAQTQGLSGGKDALLLVVMVASGCGCAKPSSAPSGKALAHVPVLPVVGHACTGSLSRQPCLVPGPGNPHASDRDGLGSHTGSETAFQGRQLR